uniref:Retrovirus-related Pol polyprotein from transposon TNT 1-94 n=1 Tax=Cajanus cajan TaxID=3821 RepID=A0A151SZ27_CAJCA|nr:hypothetical protein KK1_015455 [Cajanus cajan]
MVRAMLKGKDMPEKFWAEVVQCAIYIQNRCPHSKLDEVVTLVAVSHLLALQHFPFFYLIL